MGILEEINREWEFLSEGFVRRDWKLADLHVFRSESETLLAEPLLEGKYKLFLRYAHQN